MKEAVLKIIQERNDLLHGDWAHDLNDDEWARMKRMLESIKDAVSALPEQGYTREQVLKAVQNEIDETIQTVTQIQKEWQEVTSDEGKESKTLRMNRHLQRLSDFQYLQSILSSLTPVAVEAEANPWIPVSERLPEPNFEYMTYLYSGNRRICYLRKDHVLCQAVWIHLPTNQKARVTHWMPLPDPPKDSLAPQVNNDKTK